MRLWVPFVAPAIGVIVLALLCSTINESIEDVEAGHVPARIVFVP